MAQKTIVKFTDDIDGSEADGTVTFTLDGKAYEIDLSATNADKLRSGIAKFVARARRVGGRQKTGTPKHVPSAATTPSVPAFRVPTSKPATNAEIRTWAREKGLVIGNAGRIPAEIREAYFREA